MTTVPLHVTSSMTAPAFHCDRVAERFDMHDPRNVGLMAFFLLLGPPRLHISSCIGFGRCIPIEQMTRKNTKHEDVATLLSTASVGVAAESPNWGNANYVSHPGERFNALNNPAKPSGVRQLLRSTVAFPRSTFLLFFASSLLMRRPGDTAADFLVSESRQCRLTILGVAVSPAPS